MPFRSIFLKVGSEIGIVDLPEPIHKFLGILIGYVIPAILWITAYIRLDEKEA
jgi:hypothetical protein